jgi:hypothetical protein
MLNIKCFRHVYFLIIAGMVLAACTSRTQIGNITSTETTHPKSSPTVLPLRPFQATHTATLPLKATGLAVPTETHTLQPTSFSPKPPTLTETIFPTLTPTYDAYHLLKATQAPAETCPNRNPEVRSPDFDRMISRTSHFQQLYLDYFNAGGLVENIPDQNWHPLYNLDLTNDGIPEYILHWGDVFIMGCKSGQYKILLDARKYENDGVNGVEVLQDANLNGMPEFVLRVKLEPYIEHFKMFEWNGSEFHSLFLPGDKNITGSGFMEMSKGEAQFHFMNTDADPLLELVVEINQRSEELDYVKGFPWRPEYDYYEWNGINYVFAKHDYGPPTFRFQAVNDGDWAFAYGDYKKAILHYQKAMFEKKLLGFTSQIRIYLLEKEIHWRFPDVTPTPAASDPGEYPNLAAYSYFRMMLADLKLERLAYAQKDYDWLQSHFPLGNPGHAYAEMAANFWNTYQTNQNFSQSCMAAQAYAKLHPEEVFRYISEQVDIDGNLVKWINPTSFGYQSATINYSPQFICPP